MEPVIVFLTNLVRTSRNSIFNYQNQEALKIYYKIKLVLFSNPATSVETDTLILNAIVRYVLSTKRFEGVILQDKT